jgi:hypothetical protein
MITADDKMMFTRGCCHKLAEAIHAVSGWPVCTFFYRGQANIHAFVRTPRDTYVDIQGEHTEAELMKTWTWCALGGSFEMTIGEVSPEMLDFWDGHTIEWPEAIERAAELAPAIVDGVRRAIEWTTDAERADW